MTKTKNKNKNHHKPKIRIVSGQDYNNEQGWQTLYRMVERHVNKKYPNEYDAQWLNWMINLDKQPNGYTVGVETLDGVLQCLLIAEWHYNMWINQHDAQIVGMLTAPKCNPKYIKLCMDQAEWWAKEQDCASINIFTWDDRKAYHRWCSSRGYAIHQYTFSKELK